jgi:murein DD-endopeptidase MepM/ murein hydrolase activator NlpD
MAGTVTRDDGRVHRTLAVRDPHLSGPDVTALQKALNARLKGMRLGTIDVDGDYGPVTHQTALDVAWYLGIGPRVSPGQALSPYKQRLIHDPGQRNEKQLELARKRKKAHPPTAGVVRPLATPAGRISEFAVVDAEGAPANNGRRFHAGKDWFAPGHSPIRAPVAGKIIEAKPSLVDTGQVFGGTVKIQAADGKVWVFRHVVPQVAVGQRVPAGHGIAKVTKWRGGRSHAHIEIWKTLAGGYDFENMIDPMKYFKRFA